MDLGTFGKAMVVLLTASSLGLSIVVFVLFVCGVRTLFAKKEKVIRDYTLRLCDEGIEVVANGNRSLHRYVAIGGMTRRCGFWAIYDSTGVVYSFRPAHILEGDAAEFAKTLKEQKG